LGWQEEVAGMLNLHVVSEVFGIYSVFGMYGDFLHVSGFY
jgi:hypothetical protein